MMVEAVLVGGMLDGKKEFVKDVSGDSFLEIPVYSANGKHMGYVKYIAPKVFDGCKFFWDSYTLQTPTEGGRG